MKFRHANKRRTNHIEAVASLQVDLVKQFRSIEGHLWPAEQHGRSIRALTGRDNPCVTTVVDWHAERNQRRVRPLFHCVPDAGRAARELLAPGKPWPTVSGRHDSIIWDGSGRVGIIFPSDVVEDPPRGVTQDCRVWTVPFNQIVQESLIRALGSANLPKPRLVNRVGDNIKSRPPGGHTDPKEVELERELAGRVWRDDFREISIDPVGIRRDDPLFFSGQHRELFA
jgi:hypothetical protein